MTASSAAARPAERPAPLWPAYVAAFATVLGVSAAGVAVPLHIERLGGTATDAGVVAAIRFGIGTFFSLPFGAIADAWGPRRALTVAILAAASVQLIPLLAEPSGSLIPLYVWAVASGLSTSLFFPALSAFVGGAAPPDSRGSAFGWVTLFTHTGTASGPLIAGFAWDELGPTAAYLIAGTVAAIALLGPLFVERSVRQRIDMWAMRTAIYTVSRDRTIVGSWVAALAIGLPWGAVFGVFPLFATSIGLTGGTIGVVLAVQSVVNGGSRVPLGKAIDRLRLPAVAMAGSALAYAVAIGILGLQETAVGIGIVLGVGVMGLAFTLMMVQVVISERTSGSLRGTALGGYNTALSAGLGLGPFITGVATDAGGFAVGFATVAGAAAVCAGVSALLLRGAQRMQGVGS